MSLTHRVAEQLKRKKKTLAIAESCTGGLLAAALTDIPGSSQFLNGGVVAYSDATKQKVLKVSAKTLKRHGAVSSEVAESMSRGIRHWLKTDLGVGITGIAGPTGGTRSKPVGLTYIAVSTKHETLCLKCLLQGSRQRVRTQAVELALELLLQFISTDE